MEKLVAVAMLAGPTFGCVRCVGVVGGEARGEDVVANCSVSKGLSIIVAYLSL